MIKVNKNIRLRRKKSEQYGNCIEVLVASNCVKDLGDEVSFLFQEENFYDLLALGLDIQEDSKNWE